MNVSNAKDINVQIDIKIAAILKIILQSNSFNWSLILFVFCVIGTPNSDSIKEKTMFEKRCFNYNEIEHIVKNNSKSKMIKMNEIVKSQLFKHLKNYANIVKKFSITENAIRRRSIHLKLSCLQKIKNVEKWISWIIAIYFDEKQIVKKYFFQFCNEISQK